MNSSHTNAKVAIIGLGHIGKTIASNLVKGNHPVIVVSRDNDKSEAFASALGNLATSDSTREAIKNADVVIPAIYFQDLKEFFKNYASDLDGKIIIDVSNPIAPDGQGGFKKIIGENESAAKILLDYIPKQAKLVKTFGTLGVDSLANEAFAQPEKKVMFYASDNTNTNTVVEKIIGDSGFSPLHIGGLDQATRIEVFGDLHQFGALGKAVTLEVAKNKL